MSQTALKHTPEELAEIEKHKYFLSEKAGHDVGWQFAEEDWESKYAAQFRRSSDRQPLSQPDQKTDTFLVRLLAKVRTR